MKPLRSKVTYANVVSTLALFLVLAGGTAFAATKLAKNVVGAKQIKKEAITTVKIKNGAVTGAKVRTSSLGTVPTAANAAHASSADSAATASHASSADNATNATNALSADSAANAIHALSADNAQTVGGKSATQIAADSKLSCPPGTAMATGLCFETTERPAENWEQALLECARVGRRLPSPSELVSYEVSTGEETLPPDEWAGQVAYANPGTNGLAIRATESLVGFETPGFLASEPYRCVVGPTN
jgi:hypothetical protein